MNEPGSDSNSISGINVTPLVDVALTLVLVFMISSPFFLKTLMPVDLPKAVSSQYENEQNLTVSVSPEEGFAVNEVSVSRDKLAQELLKQRKETGFSFLLIRADETVPYGEVEDIIKTAKKTGFKRIAFATVPKQ